MPQQHRIRDETRWHDKGQVLTVPAGEPVEVVTLDKVPGSDRGTIADGIRQYQKHGRKFVPIQIRDWYALIEEKSLEQVAP